MENTADANILLELVANFQEWSGLCISIKKSLVTGALYGETEKTRNSTARHNLSFQKAQKRERESTLEETNLYDHFEPGTEDTKEDTLAIQQALTDIQSTRNKRRYSTCGQNKDPRHYHKERDEKCTQCNHTWGPSGIKFQRENLKVVHGKTAVRLLGIRYNMWSEAEVQRRKVINDAIELTSYLYRNDNLRIDQSLKLIGVCLPSLFSFSAPLIKWPEKDIKTLTAVWIQVHIDLS